ncbi:MAG TPA: glycosyltransferase family 39 protein [Lacunisphaera sp.]
MRPSLFTSAPAKFYLPGIVLLLCAGHLWLSNRAMADKSTTADEIAHLTGGYTFNHWDDYRFHPENGNLPQRWQTLPIILRGVNYPPQADAWAKSDVWLMGYRFFYQSRNDLAKMLASARFMNSFFGAATALLVFFWARKLWGVAGGLISLGFCVMSPTMLAHSALATSDMCMAFFLLASVSAFWWHLHVSRPSALLLSAITFGLACVAKFTAVLLPILAAMLILVRLCENEPLHFARSTFSTFPRKLAIIAASLAVHTVAGLFIIWLFFGFRYAAFNPTLPPGEFTFPWALMLSFGGWKAGVIELCRKWHLLPEGFLYGLAFVLRHAEARGAFLDGDYSIYGWVSFFPKAFLYKTPLSLLTALTLGSAFLVTKARKMRRGKIVHQCCRVAPLVALFGLYWAISLASHLNIGHRHLLPIYPVLFIFCGALGWAMDAALEKSRAAGTMVALLIAVLLAWQTKVAIKIYPDFLAYFSPIVGGPSEGYKHLVDSSLDWGQDLPGLKKWLNTHRRENEPVYLSYFGTGEPDYYGIKAIRILMLPNFDQRPPPWYSFEPGLYAVSATMLQHVYWPEQARWSPATERQYQQLRRNETDFRLLPKYPTDPKQLFRGLSLREWDETWHLYSQLRFARLCYYLRARKPDAMIGYSILIFRLDRDELNATVNGDFRQLAEITEKALTMPESPPK